MHCVVADPALLRYPNSKMDRKVPFTQNCEMQSKMQAFPKLVGHQQAFFLVTDDAIGTLDVVHKQTNEGIETEGVGGSLGPLTASYGFDGSFSIGAQVKDEGSGSDLHASIGVGAMNGNGMLSAGMTSKGPGGVSTSVDASYTPGLSSIGLTALTTISGGSGDVVVP